MLSIRFGELVTCEELSTLYLSPVPLPSSFSNSIPRVLVAKMTTKSNPLIQQLLKAEEEAEQVVKRARDSESLFKPTAPV